MTSCRTIPGLVLIGVLFCFAEKNPTQKIFLFLSQPIPEKNIQVKIDDSFEKNIRLDDDKKIKKTTKSNLYKMEFKEGAFQKTLLITIPAAGFLEVDVFNISGTKVTTLIRDFFSAGAQEFFEEESWKPLRDLKGVAYMTLTLDGLTHLKKLFVKME